MKDLAFHLTDLVENSLRAGAHRVDVSFSLHEDIVEITVSDDGCGMTAETLRHAAEPLFTTRTARRAGLGLPFLFQSAEQCGGCAAIDSALGAGTEVRACFPLGHPDCPPAGDLGETGMLLIVGNPDADLRLAFDCEGRTFEISSREIFRILDGIPAGHPQAACAIRELLTARLQEVFGNRLI